MSTCLFCGEKTEGGNHYQSTECIAAVRSRNARLGKLLGKAAEMLKDHAFSGRGEVGYCIDCGAPDYKDHYKGCGLAQLLLDVAGEGTGQG